MSGNGVEGTNPLGVIEGYQVFCNPDDPNASAGEGGKQRESSPATGRRRSDSDDCEPPVHFQVKDEPIDQSYEDAVNSPSEIGKALAQPAQISPSLWSSGKAKKEPRKQDSNMSNVIEQLLRKNEFLLAQNDAGGFKPNPRKSRNPNDQIRKPDNALDNNGTTFLVSQTSQARVSKADHISNKSLGPGRILRPRSPTRKCSIPEKDKSHFNHAVMESKVGDESSEKIFRVTTHEMVCAVSCRAMFMTQGGSLVAHFDLQFYWCNFCSYHTTNKTQLLQHVIEHRFHCKFCRYQSFSRADVIHHTTASHPEFAEAASALKYCTLLSDYLQIYSQDTEEDKNKRAGGSSDDEPPAKMSKLDEKRLSGLYANIDLLDQKKMETYSSLQKDYEYFDMDVETVQGAVNEDGTTEGQAVGGQSTYDVSKMITNVQSSGSAIQVLLDKSQTPGQQSVQTQNVVGNNTRFLQQNPVFSQTSPRIMGIRSISPSASIRSPAPAKPFENRPPPPPPPASKGRGSVSSNLYWSCGYCNFTSHSQGEIKEHSQKTHRGRPHRYVALIRPPEKKPEDGDKGVSTVTSKDIEIDHADDNSMVENSAENSIKTADPPTYKCFHCFYEVKKPGLLKGHMSYKHKGLSLVGLDLQCESPDKYMYFCPRDDCPFRAKNPTAYLGHVERCTPWHSKDLNVSVEANLLKCLDNTKQLAQKMMEQVRTSEEYSCIYCTFTGCYLENVAYHSAVAHPERSVVIKDLVAHRTRRKCFIYRCRFCDWESREKENWFEHCVGEHRLDIACLKNDLNVCTHGTVGSAKSKPKRKMGPKCKTQPREDEFSDPPVLSPVGLVDRISNLAVASSDVASCAGVDTSPPRLQDSTRGGATPPKMVSILPPVLQCCHCSFTCIGIPNIKEHLLCKHPGNSLYFQDMQKHSQNIPGKFYLCPYDQCVYSHPTIDKVYEHNRKFHAVTSEPTDDVPEDTEEFSGTEVQIRSPIIRPKYKPVPNSRLRIHPSRNRLSRAHSRRQQDSQYSLMPTMLKCKHCAFSCIGVMPMKKHLVDVHVGEKLVYVNLKRRKEKGRSIFQLCPFPLCSFTDTDDSRLTTHMENDHRDDVKVEESERDILFDVLADVYNTATGTVMDEDSCDLNGASLESLTTSQTTSTSNDSTKGDLPTTSVSKKKRHVSNDSTKTEEHSIDTTPSGTFKEYCCLLCQTFANTLPNMKEHYAESHPGEDVVVRDINAKRRKRPSRVYMCNEPQCAHNFTNSQALLVHRLAHSCSPAFECSQCRWVHPELVKVMNHVDRHHNKDDVDINYVTVELEKDGITVKKSPATKTERL